MERTMIYLVTWVDAGQRAGWHNRDEVENWAKDLSEFVVFTVGFIIVEDDEYLVIAQGMTSKELLLSPVRIRRENILSMEALDGKKTKFDQADSGSTKDREQEGATR
jgi:hypothetical protein